MSAYKVPQDVEAEDKLVGPFTLKQFIFLIVAAIAGYITFVLASVNPILMILTLPVVVVFGTLGIYRRSDQPVELYLAAVIRFYLKPHRRIWDQDGIMEPVHITTPPRIEHRYTDGRSQGQVSSQLKNLASMMDTRGWSTKDASLQVPVQYGLRVSGSDRLIASNQLPTISQPSEIHASDDILDYKNNALAQSMNTRAQNSTTAMRQTAVNAIQQAAPVQQQPPRPYPVPQPAAQPITPSPANSSTSTMTAEPTPDIIRLSQNSDFNVSTVARQADHAGQDFEDNTEVSLR